MKKRKLTPKQLEVMEVLWNNPSPMVASEIVKSSLSLNINTVQTCLRQLIKGELIQIADIVYSGTVLTRSYTPVISKEEFYSEFLKTITGGSPFSFFASLINIETDTKELDELEKLISKKKDELKKE